MKRLLLIVVAVVSLVVVDCQAVCRVPGKGRRIERSMRPTVKSVTVEDLGFGESYAAVRSSSGFFRGRCLGGRCGQ